MRYAQLSTTGPEIVFDVGCNKGYESMNFLHCLRRVQGPTRQSHTKYTPTPAVVWVLIVNNNNDVAYKCIFIQSNLQSGQIVPCVGSVATASRPWVRAGASWGARLLL